jgi:hypothetical protein
MRPPLARSDVPLEALDRDDPKPSTPADAPAGLAKDAVPDDPAEPESDPDPGARDEEAGAEGVDEVAGCVRDGFGTAGVATVGVVVDVDVGVDVVTLGVVTVGVVTVGVEIVGVVMVDVVMVGVVMVGRVVVVSVGSVGGSRASAGPTAVAVVATATATHTIHRALGIRLYNLRRPLQVTLFKSQKPANCNFFAGAREAD